MGDYAIIGGDRRRASGGCCPSMDLMRSEPMQLVQVIVPIESAHLTVSYLGDLGLLQFKDDNCFRGRKTLKDPTAPSRAEVRGHSTIEQITNPVVKDFKKFKFEEHAFFLLHAKPRNYILLHDH